MTETRLLEDRIMDLVCRMDAPAVVTTGWLFPLINGRGTIVHPPTVAALRVLVERGELVEAHGGWMLAHPLRQLEKHQDEGK